MKPNNSVYLFIFILGLGMLTGCYKDTTVILDTTPEVTRTVTFSADILPFLNTTCAVSGCHTSGGHIPDLSADKAYNSLSLGGYFNTGNPEGSEVYLWLTGKKTTVMPVSGMNKDFNALMLAWIKQGALNN